MRLAILATVAAACGGTTAPPQRPIVAAVDAGVPVPVADAAPPLPLERDLPRLAQRAVLMLQAIRGALDAAGDDCAAATLKLGDVQRSFADVVTANALVVQGDRKAELAAAMAPQQAALDAAGAAVVHAHTVSACVAQPEFAAALDRALGAPAP
jgi:hypothetical protein